MTYIAADESTDGVAKVICGSKDGKISKAFDALDLWDERKPPPCANGPPPEAFIIYDESSSPSADDYLIDADRSTLRLSTGYPIESWMN